MRKCPLFHDVEDENIISMIGCLGAIEKSFQKKDMIIAEGETARYVGIVLTGSVQIERTDYFGNRSIVSNVGPSELFGESFACAGMEKIPVNVVANEDAKILFIDCFRITQSCSNACLFHQQMIFNLLKVVATKNLAFHQKLEITSKRSTREKLMTYLLLQAKKNNSNSFTMPFDRQELADYLEVERSGLSMVISKLCQEGILESKRNLFVLKM